MKILFTVSLLSALLLSALLACSAPEIIQQERQWVNDQLMNNPQIRKQTLNYQGNTLFYASNGDPAKPALIIIHGTPGSWHQYARYMLNKDLLQNVQVVVIDRPGFGQSTLAADKLIANFKEQAAMIAALAKHIKQGNAGQPILLMGHSLGSSIAPRVAMDYPKLIDGLLLFAGTLTVDLANPRWFNHLASVPGVYYLLNKSMVKANKEIFALKENLSAMQALWKDLSAYTLVVQGMKDELVYPANIDFAESVLNPTWSHIVRLPDEGHLFPMYLRKEVVKWSLCALKSIQVTKNRCYQTPTH